MTKILIKSAKILDAGSSHHGKIKDVLIDKGQIVKIGKIEEKANQTIDAKGMILSLGWLDMRAWFADPGYEHKEDVNSGREVAMEGGFTGVALLPNNKPVTQSKNDISYLRSGNQDSLTQIYPIAAVTHDTKGEDLTEMIDLYTAGAVAFSDGLQPTWHSDILLKTLQYLQKFDGLLIDRPEDVHLNMFGVMNEGISSTMLGMKGMPNLAEDIIVQRNLDILAYSGGRLHMSCISTPHALSLIKAAKKKGLQITCDMAAYQTSFDDGALADFDTSYKVNPPFRTANDNKALIKGLQEDVIDVIVSGHVPHDEESKKLEYDLAEFGIISMQTVAANIAELAKKVEMEVLIEKLTTNPRKLLKLQINPIEEGIQADLTLFDPAASWVFDKKTNKSKSVNSPFWNKTMIGKTIAVFNNGKHHINHV
jgi:dihydroorotase